MKHLALTLVLTLLSGVAPHAFSQQGPNKESSDTVARPRTKKDGAPAAEEPATADISTSESASLVFGELRADPPVVISKRNTHRVHRAAYIPRRHTPEPEPRQVTDFFPTTLVIYAEDGEIKTRIEPNLTAAYKIPASFAN